MNQRWVLNVDIEDFFGSINFARIRGLFLSPLFGFNKRVATILARICTYNDHLPQGAVTSPVLANLIAKNLDKRLIGLAVENKLKYSRYADDITFSSSHRHKPEALIKEYSIEIDAKKIVLGDRLHAAFRNSGFQINAKKTRLQLWNERQEVTGLVVNRKVNILRKDLSRLRMKIYSAIKYSPEEAALNWLGKDATAIQFSNHIEGWLSYVRQVRGENDPVLAKLCKMAINAKITEIEWIMTKAEMVREFDVFLSHASEDKDRIRKLKDALEENGISVFFDEDSIKWGDSIVDKINFGLLKSTYFMPFLTETFAEKGWTNKELNSAISQNANQKGRILPIKEAGFDIDKKYPLLNETLYKAWPTKPEAEAKFISTICDEIMLMVEKDKQSKLQDGTG